MNTYCIISCINNFRVLNIHGFGDPRTLTVNFCRFMVFSDNKKWIVIVILCTFLFDRRNGYHDQSYIMY